MATPYLWRKLTDQQRADLLKWPKDRRRPWHWPHHRPDFGREHFHVTAACYEHAPIIGTCADRMDSFSSALSTTIEKAGGAVFAWAVLPNHYHLLLQTQNILKLLFEIGRLHGRTAHAWNLEDNAPKRKVFHGAAERSMRSERHYWATVNYVHNNPVRHGYAEHWQDWRWCSAAEFIEKHGRAEAERIWREFPLKDYGDGWDDPEL
jgi:putative transposase